MESSSPFFSVIIPTYNRAQLLREAVQSVLDQTYENFELIIVDDHSTDNTKDTVWSFKDDRITYIMNDRAKGAAGARNAGIFRANGEWIAFLDSDDIWLSQKLEKQAKMIQGSDETVGFIYAGYAVYDFEKKKEVAVYLPQKEGWIQKDLLYTNYITSPGSVAAKKSILLKTGGFDEDFPALEDWELFVRIAGITKFGMLKEKLVYVRRTNKDRLSTRRRLTLTGILLFRQKYNDLLIKHPKPCFSISATILIWALEARDWTATLKAFPWILAGPLLDPYKFASTMKSILSELISQIFKPGGWRKYS